MILFYGLELDSVSNIGNGNLTLKDWKNYLFVMKASSIAPTL
jgi:hypothetical protein